MKPLILLTGFWVGLAVGASLHSAHAFGNASCDGASPRYGATPKRASDIFKNRDLDCGAPGVITERELAADWERLSGESLEALSSEADLQILSELNQRAATVWSELIACTGDAEAARSAYLSRKFSCRDTSQSKAIGTALSDLRRNFSELLMTTSFQVSARNLWVRRAYLPRLHPLLPQIAAERLAQLSRSQDLKTLKRITLGEFLSGVTPDEILDLREGNFERTDSRMRGKCIQVDFMTLHTWAGTGSHPANLTSAARRHDCDPKRRELRNGAFGPEGDSIFVFFDLISASSCSSFGLWPVAVDALMLDLTGFGVMVMGSEGVRAGRTSFAGIPYSVRMKVDAVCGRLVGDLLYYGRWVLNHKGEVTKAFASEFKAP